MIIHLVSDLHLEFGYQEMPGGDVLILAGDICEARTLRTDFHKTKLINRVPGAFKAYDFFYSECVKYKKVFMVMGNHEHYHGDVNRSYDIIRKTFKHLSNLYVMDNEVRVIDDITFVGGTLWTDMNKKDPSTLYSIKGVMNDFRIIKNSSRKVTFKDEAKKFHERVALFCPEDTVEDHKAMITFIDETTKDSTKKYVVVGHHSPSKASTHPRYKEEWMMNGAYSSDLSEFILDRPQIKLWTHGHTHDPYDYMIGSTRIVCNPRGYIHYEEIADNFEFKLLEV